MCETHSTICCSQTETNSAVQGVLEKQSAWLHKISKIFENMLYFILGLVWNDLDSLVLHRRLKNAFLIVFHLE